MGKILTRYNLSKRCFILVNSSEGDRSTRQLKCCYGKYSSLVWNLAPLCLVWTIWSEMNSCNLNWVEGSVIELKSAYWRQLFEWTHIFGITEVSVVDFVDFFSFHLCFFYTIFFVASCVHEISIPLYQNFPLKYILAPVNFSFSFIFVPLVSKLQN